jgi:hypothetical protein
VPTRCSSTLPCNETNRAAAGSHRSCAALRLEINTASPSAQVPQYKARENRPEAAALHIPDYSRSTMRCAYWMALQKQRLSLHTMSFSSY